MNVLSLLGTLFQVRSNATRTSNFLFMGKTVSFTAFLVNESRRRRVDLSQDSFAHLWVDHDTSKAWEHFAANVTPFDDLVISLRHSYFLERIQSFMNKNPDGVLVNLGAGFTSYPFLLGQDVEVIEVDRHEVIEFKTQKIESWILESKIPKRKVHFIAEDLLIETGRIRTFNRLHELVNSRPTFILMEGLSYFLNEVGFTDLIDRSVNLSPQGSLVGFDFWMPEMKSTRLFKRLMDYVEREWKITGLEPYFLTDEKINKYRGLKRSEFSSGPIEEIRKLGSQKLADDQEVMVEHYRIMQRV